VCLLAEFSYNIITFRTRSHDSTNSLTGIHGALCKAVSEIHILCYFCLFVDHSFRNVDDLGDDSSGNISSVFYGKTIYMRRNMTECRHLVYYIDDMESFIALVAM